MLRLCCRIDPLVRFNALRGARQPVLWSFSPRCFSATPVVAKSSAPRKRRRRESLLRNQSTARSRAGKSTKTREASAKKKKKSVPSTDSIEGSPEDGENSLEPAAGRGAGMWTSLRERLQASSTKGMTEEDADEETMAPLDPITDEEGSSKRGAATKGKRTRSKTAALDVKTIRPRRLHLHPVEEAPLQVPKLCHNLDRVLFNPGVYHMQDDRSRVYNFDPYLASIMPVDEFDFDALKAYITSSKDVKLRQLSAAHGMKYCGSTSSMTSILSHFHFLLSAWRKPNFSNLSRSITPESFNFTALSRAPAAAFARFNDGVYAIDSDKEYDTENILSMLGKSMEKLLTLPKEEFERYRRTKSHQIPEEERNAEEAYHYTTLGDFMMRSQLDAHDPRLPGTGMFDLKTRAVVSIRMDVDGYEKGVGYEIRKRFGQWESFEREYYDMVRTAFLKYSLQVRMGRMDGIFVAFHNTQRIFGFQYISLEEMDASIHGAPDRRLGDLEFKASLALLNDLLNTATERFPGRSLRLHVETRPTKVPLTYFFVEPVSDEEMTNIQEASQTSVEQLEREIRDLSEKEREAESTGADEVAQADLQQPEDSEGLSDEPLYQDAQNDAAWEIMMARVEEAVEDESLGVGSVREAVHEALEQSGLLKGKSELETEQYLDAMVASLTSHSSKIKELRDRSDDASETIEPAHQHETDVDGSGVETSSTMNQSEESEPASTASGSITQNASLKDLILKVTEGIDKNAQNLKTFQRMFADLATQTKQPDSESQDLQIVGSQTEDEAPNEENDVDVEDTADDASSTAESDGPQRELLGMYVTIRNKVNGEYVERPKGQGRDFDWAIQYAVTELPDKRAQKIYSEIKKRRKTVFAMNPTARATNWHKMFSGTLPAVTQKGEKYREKRTLEEAGNPVYVAWDEVPLSAKPPAQENSQVE